MISPGFDKRGGRWQITKMEIPPGGGLGGVVVVDGGGGEGLLSFLAERDQGGLISQLASAAVEYRAENGFPEEHDYPPVQADQGKILTIAYL